MANRIKEAAAVSARAGKGRFVVFIVSARQARSRFTGVALALWLAAFACGRHDPPSEPGSVSVAAERFPRTASADAESGPDRFEDSVQSAPAST